jgi:hypothetical protein
MTCPAAAGLVSARPWPVSHGGALRASVSAFRLVQPPHTLMTWLYAGPRDQPLICFHLWPRFFGRGRDDAVSMLLAARIGGQPFRHTPLGQELRPSPLAKATVVAVLSSDSSAMTVSCGLTGYRDVHQFRRSGQWVVDLNFVTGRVKCL